MKHYDEENTTPEEKEILLAVLRKNSRVQVPVFMLHNLKVTKDALNGKPIRLLDVPSGSVFHFPDGRYNKTPFTLVKVKYSSWDVKAYLKPQEKYRGSYRQVVMRPGFDENVVMDYIPDEIHFGGADTTIPKEALMNCKNIEELACKYATGRVYTELMDLEIEGSFYRKLIAEIK